MPETPGGATAQKIANPCPTRYQQLALSARMLEVNVLDLMTPEGAGVKRVTTISSFRL